MRRFRRRAESTETAPAEAVESVEPRRLVLRRSGLPFVINWRAMLVVVGLAALTAFALLLNQGALPAQVVTWWPLVVAILAAIWFLAALVGRDARSLLGSTTLLGLSVSMLLAAQNIASLSATWVGITFIATGTGIVLRGLLLRHQPIG